MAAEGEAGSSGSQSLDTGDMWRQGGPKSRIETVTSNRRPKVKAILRQIFREHNVESLVLHAFGLNWSGDTVSLLLWDWERARVALSCHVALDMLWQEVHEPWWLDWKNHQESLVPQQAKPLLSPWTGPDRTEKDVERMIAEGAGVTGRSSERRTEREQFWGSFPFLSV